MLVIVKNETQIEIKINLAYILIDNFHCLNSNERKIVLIVRQTLRIIQRGQTANEFVVAKK